MYFTQVQPNSKLGISNETGSQLVEVSEELRDSDAVLRAELSDAGKHVLDIQGAVSNDLGLANSWASLGEVVKAVVVILTNTKESSCAVNLFAEVSVVNLVNIALVHVTSKDVLGNLLGGRDLKKVKHS